MTVAAEIPLALYDGDGVTVAFPAPWRYLTTAHLLVELIAIDGTATPRALGTHYSATAGATDAGGTVTMVTPPAVGQTLRIRRVTPLAQQTAYPTSGNFPAKSHELALDRLTLIAQEQAGDIDDMQARAFQVPFGEVAPPFPPIAERAGKYIAFDAAGLPVAASGVGTDDGLRTDLAAAGGAANVGFQQSGLAPMPATVQSKARQILSAADFTGFDATGLAASTTAIQNAINEGAARGRCDVLIPNGAKMGAVTLSSGVTLVGPESKAAIVSDVGTYTTITLQGSDCGVKNLSITETAKAGGATYLMACGTSGKDRNTIENVVTVASWKLFEDSGTGNGVHTTTKLRDIQAKAHRGPGVTMTRGFAFLELDHVIIDYVGVVASDYTGMTFSGAGLPAGAGGLIIERCDVLGTMGVTTNPNQIGMVFNDLAAVRIRNSRSDTVGNDGWRFTNCNGIIMDDVTAGLCDGHGMVFTSCVSVIANKLFLFGRNYLTTPGANKDGLLFVSGNAGCIFGTTVARDFTRHGVHKLAAQAGAINIAGVSMYGNTGRGVRSAGNSGFTVTGAQFGGNVAGNYDLGGNSDYISGQLNSGAFSPSIGPGPVTG